MIQRSRRWLPRLAVLFLCGFLVFGCAWKYRALNTVAEWTNKNFDKYEELYPKADQEEQAWMRANIAPYMNILKHAVIGLGAIEENNDVELSHEVYMIVKIAYGVRYNTHGLEFALNSKNKKLIKQELLELQGWTQMKMGIIAK